MVLTRSAAFSSMALVYVIAVLNLAAPTRLFISRGRFLLTTMPVRGYSFETYSLPTDHTSSPAAHSSVVFSKSSESPLSLDNRVSCSIKLRWSTENCSCRMCCRKPLDAKDELLRDFTLQLGRSPNLAKIRHQEKLLESEYR